MDIPPLFSGEDEPEGRSHRLSNLNTEASSHASVKVKCDALVIPQAKEISSEKPTSQTTKINTEGLETYPMTAAKRGVCLIINNYDFTKSKLNPVLLKPLQNREGTMADERCLTEVFKWLGFEVVVRQDCDSRKMLSELKELGRQDHSQMDCLVCCILSHGREGSVYGVDGHPVPLKDLMEQVNGSKCFSLAVKPKLFFIQACQGNNEQRPVFIEADGPSRGAVCTDAVVPKESIPCDADVLLAMATVPNFVSFRERTKGTWFIQSLCKNLVEMVPSRCDLVSIMTKVNADVSRMTDTTHVKKQMPQPAFTLRKRVIFPIPKADPPVL